MPERIWDKFLTEQDKASLEGRQERRIGWGEHPALLFIDLYRAVFGDKPEPLLEAIKRWPSSCGLGGKSSTVCALCRTALVLPDSSDTESLPCVRVSIPLPGMRFSNS